MDKKWDSLTREELLELYVKENYVDNEVARLFGVSKGQVAYKRKKYDISQATIMFKRFTTHTVSLLHTECTRPDCAFMIEKGFVKNLCNLTDRELREAHNIEKLYRSNEFVKVEE